MGLHNPVLAKLIGTAVHLVQNLFRLLAGKRHLSNADTYEPAISGKTFTKQDKRRNLRSVGNEIVNGRKTTHTNTRTHTHTPAKT